ncbi:MAG: uroporphyrinogen decarboxylase family protein [Dethiobacteraceae bacterium]|jgi:uroporphyrinogen-III decarboxylase
MLTKKQNLLETIRGGKPDRFVNQFEAFAMVFGDPLMANAGPMPAPGGEAVNGWGVTIRWPEHVPGPFPVHDEEHKVVKDITKWQQVVKAPSLETKEEDWTAIKEQAAAVDRDEQFVTVFGAPGIFEQLHYLMGMDDTLINFYEEPKAMHELIEYITEYKLGVARELVKHVRPDCLLHHDDWGSQISSFMSPEMFKEFIVPAFKKIYSFYKENGVELIVHHSDSYAANLVPYMIEMGIDIWQGCMSTNNIPELIKKYGGQISFMGGIDNGKVDRADWTEEKVAAETERVVRDVYDKVGNLYFIPNTTVGGPGSTYPGVYDAVSREIARLNKEIFNVG